MVEQQIRNAVVIDSGSGTIKAGIAGQYAPSSVCPSVIAMPRHSGVMVGMHQPHPYFGTRGLALRALLVLDYPIKSGIVRCWDKMELIWNHTLYTDLNSEPKEHFVLLTESPLNPVKDREKMTEIMFGTFDIPGLCVCSSAMLSLYASGRTTGLVIESGKEATHVVPIFKYQPVTHAIQSLNATSGRNLTDYMMQLLSERGYSFATSAEKEIARDIKEKLGYVSLDFGKEMSQENSNVNKDYELPESIITIGDERFRCTEPMFSPSHIGLSAPGLQYAANNSIMKCDTDIHKYLYSNIVLSGGNTMFPGMGQRIEKEMKRLAASGTQVKVVSPPDRIYSAWMGGSTLASLDHFESLCITKVEYDEVGPTIVHRKCFL